MKICAKCGFEGDDDQFRKGRNICKKCHSEYNKAYREQNSERIKQVQKEYWAREGKDKRRESVRNAEERTVESFLAVQARQARHRCGYSKKRNWAHYDECDIDTAYLLKLWEENDGKCAITGMPMTHKTGSIRTVSMDRIDSNASYMQGNIQLVCKGVNLLKGKHTQEEAIEFFQDLVALARLEEAPVRRIYTVDISKCKNHRELELVKNAAQQVMDQIDDGPTNGA